MTKSSKDRLFETARHLFAVNGYECTSTRDIAQAADVNISAITYYFGGKLGLYQAVLSDIAKRISTELQTKKTAAQALLASATTTPEQAETMLCSLVADLCFLLCSRHLPNEDAVIFLHEYSAPGEAFDALYQGLILPVYKISSDLMIKATDNALNAETAALCTFQLFAGMFVFKSRKQTILQHLHWDGYGEKEINQITDMIVAHTHAVLNLYKNQKG